MYTKMEIKELILNKLAKKKEIKASEIVKETGFTRAYINRFFKELQEEGKIILLGKANRSRYVFADPKVFMQAKKKIKQFHRILVNKDLAEDIILDEAKRETGIFFDIPENVIKIIDYSFTEMLNNAIDHSHSKKIEVTVKKDQENIRFDVFDQGVGIFRDIMKKKKLNSELGAIQELIKGKLTTLPERHTGEGIFFTSRVADMLIIQSSNKKIVFNNILDDTFIKDIKNIKGTQVTFVINAKSKRRLEQIFKKFSGDSYEFSKTRVLVKLYKMGQEYISRSQARRITNNLERFKTITIDFKNVNTVGQAFADEIFRVWQNHHPDIKIVSENANENTELMINRALRKE